VLGGPDPRAAAGAAAVIAPLTRCESTGAAASACTLGVSPGECRLVVLPGGWGLAVSPGGCRWGLRALTSDSSFTEEGVVCWAVPFVTGLWTPSLPSRAWATAAEQLSELVCEVLGDPAPKASI
jgi:hypothetical protein